MSARGHSRGRRGSTAGHRTDRRRATARWLASAVLIAIAAIGAIGTVGHAAADDARARRIVTVGSDITEIVFALGAGDRVVAIDTTSLWPPQAQSLPRVGYLRNLAAEGILSLSPDLLLAAGAAGPDSTIAQLRATGTRILQAPERHSLDAAREKIGLVAGEIGARDEAVELLARFDRDAAALATATAGFESRPRVAFLLSAAAGSPQAAGRGTSADAVLQLVGARNVFAHAGFKAVAAEAMAAAAPDVILMMPHALAAAGGVEAVAALPGIALTPAGRQRRIRPVDAVALLSFGPRTPGAALALARALREP